MRMMMTGPGSRPLARPILGCFYGYFFLHWATGILLFREKLGFSYASVVRYYRGDAELFMNPRSLTGLLEVTHFHLFAMGLFFVVFSHLLLLTRLRPGLQRFFVGGLAAALGADIAAGWLVTYAGAPFAWLKLAAFWLLQALCLSLLTALGHALLQRPHSLTIRPESG